MSKVFRGVIAIDIKQSTPDWEPYTQPKAPEGAPNVLYIVLDDVGFGAMEPLGGHPATRSRGACSARIARRTN
jgi:hypothetical protein